MIKEGKLIVIVAPSGTGKSTLIKKVKAELDCLVESISYTTRPLRTGDQHGVQYFFVSKEEFIKMRDQNEFLEWAQVHSNFYGTSKRFVEEQLAMGRNLLFDIDIQGADSFKKYFGKKANIIFIEPPSLDELEKRLVGRATDSMEVIKERLKNASSEITRKNDYDYKVLNDELGRAYEELTGIIDQILKR